MQLHFTGVEKYREPQFTGQFAAEHFEVYEVKNLKNTDKPHFTGQKGADGQVPVKRSSTVYFSLENFGKILGKISEL